MDNKKQERLSAIKSMYSTYNYNGKVYLFGFGAIGHPILYMFLKIVTIDPSNITVIDKMDKHDENKYFRKKGVKFVKAEITKDNYRLLLQGIGKNDMIIDCAYNIMTADMIRLCQEVGCHYINSCIEFWDYKGVVDPIEYSLYRKHKELDELNKSFGTKNFNAIISMGCNPGNVSIWTKLGLEKLAQVYGIKDHKSFAELAQKLEVQTIHISERDTQQTKDPKQPNEYCNTWASDGEAFYEEILGCVEASWGTHEEKMPKHTIMMKDNFIIMDYTCIHTMAQSVVPLYGRYFGYIIRHDEVNTIGKTLELREGDKIIYKPSIYYVYHPCDSAKISMDELTEKDKEYHPKWRLLTYEITKGRDILGVSFFLKNGDVWWIGSVLCIDEAREIFDHKMDRWVNATNTQVMAGYISGILYILDLIKKGENRGMMDPDDLPHREIWEKMKPFLGDFLFTKIDNFALLKQDKRFTDKSSYTKDWQFENFLVKSIE